MALHPGVSAAAMIALALGIGANTSVFSVVRAVLLRPLPFHDADGIVAAAGLYQDLREWKEQCRSFAAVAAVRPSSMNLATRQEPERIPVARVNHEFLAMLGVRPAVGRDFLAEEDRPGAARVVLLTDSLWKRRFGADPAIIGRTLRLDGESYSVVGVMPPGFRFDVVRDSEPPELFAPLALPASPEASPWVFVYGRLRPGLPLRQAQAEAATIFARLDANRPPGERRQAPGFVTLRESMVGDVRRSLTVLAGAVALVLLIACANVANLLLARASTRRKEMALRAALGAGRLKLLSQLILETLPLGIAGGVVGLLLAWMAIPLLRVVPSQQVPFLNEVRMDGAVLAFTAAVSLATTFLFGLAPAWAASRVDLQAALQEGGRSATPGASGTRLRNLLVVAEIGLSVVLAIGATLLVRSFQNLRTVDPGFRPEGIVTVQVGLPPQRYPDATRRILFFDRVLENLRAIPGVQAAAMASEMPLSGTVNGGGYIQEGAPFRGGRDVMMLFSRTVDQQYFRTLQIPLRRGRLFDARDTANSPLVAVISETTARRFWPNQDPIGKRVAGGELGKWTTIVGIVGDVRHEDVGSSHTSEILFPYAQQSPQFGMTLAVRTDPAIYPDPQRFSTALSHAVAQVDPGQAVSHATSMPALMRDRLAMRRLAVVLLAVFAGLALTLAAVGIYGVLSFAVARRTHEIGVRVALGAGAPAVIRMVVGQAAALALAGSLLGLAGAFALTRVMRSMLYGVSPTDPVVFAAIVAVLAAVAVLAGYLPARRAARVEPLAALRCE